MKILIVRVGAMGDILHGLSAVAALRQARPHCVIDWVVDERWRSLLSSGDLSTDVHGPLVDLTLPVPIKQWKRFPRSSHLLRSLHGLHGLRRLGYDHVIDLQGTLRSAVIGRLAGAGRLTGFATPRETPAKLFYNRQFPREGVHVVQQNTALVAQACGLELTPGYAQLPHDEQAASWAETLLRSLARPSRVALLAPSAGWPAKQWPGERFAALARTLHAEGWSVLVNQPGGDEPAATAVLALTGDAAQGISCSVAEFTALLRRTHLLVGGDSGPTHLAAALQVPLVALFGPTDPERNGPWGPGPKRVLRDPGSITSYSHVATSDPGLERITVLQVLDAVHEVRP